MYTCLPHNPNGWISFLSLILACSDLTELKESKENVSFFFSARTGLHGLVRDLIKRRRQDDDKAEKLFIDSILDCDFMDEEEVC